MSGSFFTDLGLPKPDVHLEVGSGSHAAQTAEIMRRFEAVVLEEKPDLVMVFGDVNSTVACALVTSKIVVDSSGKRPLIAHVEAGLRSFDRAMPEEINRVITDHLSDLLFVTEDSGRENLCREGINPEQIHFVGNTMIDSLLASEEKAEKSAVLDQFGLRGGANGSVRRYALLTLHRPSNVDDRETFLSILEGLDELAASCPILFSAHPRTRKRIVEFGLERFFYPESQQPESQHPENQPSRNENGIRLLDPLGYLDFLCLTKHAAIVVTDSGGIQEETTCLRVPCVTVRENTERPITVTCGTNVIAGTRSENIRRAVKEQFSGKKQGRIPEKWDGQAAGRIVAVIAREFQMRSSLPDSQIATLAAGQ
jgi:UDP-N-acetylglucosamine 2-epimerase (non-hydrolysing)